MKKPRKKKTSVHNQCLFLIKKLCANPKDLAQKKMYGREVVACKKLLKKYSFEKLKSLQILQQDKPNSILGFLTKEGEKLLNVLLLKSNIKESEIKELSKSKEIFGEDIEYKKKPKTLLGFMDYEPESKRKD